MSSWIFILIFIVLSLFYNYHFFASIQLNGYNALKIIDSNNKKLIRFVFYNFINCIIFFIINFLLFYFNIKYNFIPNIVFLSIFILLIYKNKSNFIKTPLKYTNRMIRLYVSTSIILSAILLLLTYFYNPYINLILPLLPIVDIIFVIICFYIILPFELLNNYKYKLQAKKRFDNKKLVKIAITGSYGKTSVKHILTHILSSKYNTLTTEKNYNTELGLAISSKKINNETDIFVAEFGARHKGDIKKLCKICKPDIAIITGICNQHLETFKFVENIISTKSEILQNTSCAFFNGNNKYTKSMYDKFDNEKYITFSNECYVKDVEYLQTGTKFTIVINNEEAKCFTKLLGKSCVENILLASFVAYKLGIKIEEIAKSINTLPYIQHRLEVINGAVTIIDDSYNSNEIGITEALFVLNLFDKEKVVLASGLVELGSEENQVNIKLGEMLSTVSDKIILIDTKQSKYILDGLNKNNFPKEKIYIYNTIDNAIKNFNNVLNSNSVILLMSDLPSNYSV